MTERKAAILMVNGGLDPAPGKWLDLSLNKIQEFTDWPDYHIFVWNNNIKDSWIGPFVSGFPNATLVSAPPGEILAHRHAVPLQRLFELARQAGAEIILTMDTDAFPIRRGWLTELVTELDRGNALAGIWLEEASGGIRPYVHPSCLCTTLDFIEENQLRFDEIPRSRGERYDTLSLFTDKALELGRGIHKLRRTNRNEIHRVIGGIYGEIIYHHGAGSRPGASFWDEPRQVEINQKNLQIRDLAAEMVFRHPEKYLNWLGHLGKYPRGIFILGMHRSGTSCLVGSLEQSGLYLGDVTRYNKGNPQGNHEVRPLVRLHEEILEETGGSWEHPPPTLRLGESHRQAIQDAAAEFSKHSPFGLKDPRLIFLLDPWTEACGDSALVGTFRHPAPVAQSLIRRDQMSEEQAYKIWLRYNAQLVRRHQEQPFPLIEFDLSDLNGYCESVAEVAISLGLRPVMNALLSFVNEKLDHGSSRSDWELPPACEEVYQYLQAHRYRPGAFDPDSFEALLLKWSHLVDAPVEVDLKERLKYRMYRVIGLVPAPIRLAGRRFLRRLKGPGS